MTEKNFQDLVDKEQDTREDHMSGDYSSEERERWQDARDELVTEFKKQTGGNRNQK